MTLVKSLEYHKNKTYLEKMVRHGTRGALFRMLLPNGTPLQHSCLENPREGGAWWAAVYGDAQSRTRLKQLSSSSSSP